VTGQCFCHAHQDRTVLPEPRQRFSQRGFRDAEPPAKVIVQNKDQPLLAVQPHSNQVDLYAFEGPVLCPDKGNTVVELRHLPLVQKTKTAFFSKENPLKPRVVDFGDLTQVNEPARARPKLSVGRIHETLGHFAVGQAGEPVVPKRRLSQHFLQAQVG
jgi:hypothetical protein